MDAKERLRAQMYEKRRILRDGEADYRSMLAQRRLLADPVWKSSLRVTLYYAVRKEISTNGLLEAAWNEGKDVLLPRTVPGPNRLLQLLPCTGFEGLIPGAFGILEPDPATCPPPERIVPPDLIVVPGVAFDRKGYRLGSGCGYYDRLFARPGLAPIKCIGFAYSFQIVDAIPGLEQWDLPMHGYCTDEEIKWL